MSKLFAALVVGVLCLALGSVAPAKDREAPKSVPKGHAKHREVPKSVPGVHARGRAATKFVAVLSAENEVPGCPAGEESGAGGRAMVRIDEETGEIRYHVVARHLPGTIAGSPGAHIHVGAAGEIGPVVQGLVLTGREQGLVAKGTATNPALAEAILADPANYYVNVHTTACPGGAVRGQLG